MPPPDSSAALQNGLGRPASSGNLQLE